ncbi:MAG TPA: HAD-IIA family hydrolase [Lapillicoccus sp.]|nr:HAD-IIA family hydrolase [Lapillicoccus sp.]
MADSLAARYTGVVCDLDGVVRRGSAAVPYAVEQLTALTAPVVYATNNASLTPQDVADQLAGLGLPAGPEHVVTSSQAGAAHVADRFAAGASVLAVGGPGVAAALAEAGMTPVTTAEAGVVAVLQGYGPNVTATDLAEAAYAIEGGATWVATNRDATLPTHRGIAPGNGALLGAVATATGVQPAVATGKPEPPLYNLAVTRLGVPKPQVLAIGDRLDTDILGAMNAGLDSLWVLTGVDDLVSFARAPGRPTPMYAARDLRALAAPPLVPVRDGDDWVCGSVRLIVQWESGDVRVDGAADDLDALVAAGAAALAFGRDQAGVPHDALTRVAGAVASRLG